jgi:hypothetical protein
MIAFVLLEGDPSISVTTTQTPPGNVSREMMASLPIPPSFASLVLSNSSDRPSLKWCGQSPSSCRRCQSICYPIICDPGRYACISDSRYTNNPSSLAVERASRVPAPLKARASLCHGLCYMCVDDKESTSSYCRCSNCRRYFHNNNHCSSSEDVLRPCNDKSLCEKGNPLLCFHCTDSTCSLCNSAVCTRCGLNQCDECDELICHQQCHIIWCVTCETDGDWCTSCFKRMHVHDNEDEKDEDEDDY